MSDDTKRFVSHFKMPKSQMNQIKKQYEDGKAVVQSIDPESLINFKEKTDEVFDFFEEITGKKVHRESMKGYIHYYLDEGFLPQEMKDFIRHQVGRDFYKDNPELLAIFRLFPSKDVEKINHTWDLLAHFQSLRGEQKEKKIKGVTLLLRCGHQADMQAYRENPVCTPCGEAEKLDEWFKKEGHLKKEELIRLGFLSEILIQKWDAQQARSRNSKV